MAAFEFDWAYIRRHTTRPLASTVAMVLALVAALWLHSQQTQLFSDYSSSYTTVRRDFDQLLAEQRMVASYQRRFERLVELGFIAPESRLDLIETVRTAAEGLSLPRVTYAIDPQLEVSAPVRSAVRNNDMKIRVSRAQLELGASHELDVLRFFDELQQNAPGLIKVDECDLSWRSDLSVQLMPGNNLAAHCSVQIYSVTTSEFVAEDT